MRIAGLIPGTLLLAAAYFGCARLGLHLQFETTQASPIWPPSGLAFAAVLLFGPRVAAGIFLGALLANLAEFVAKASPLFDAVAASTAIGAGNMLEAIVGAALVRRFAPDAHIGDSVRSGFRFVLAGLLGALVASVLGVLALLVAGALPPALATAAWLTWLLGDAAGIWIFAPLLVAWGRSDRARLTREPWRALALALAAIVVLNALTFSPAIARALAGTPGDALVPVLLRTAAYALLPALLWVEFRFGRLAGTIGIAITATLAVLGTVAGHGPFVGASQNESLLMLQGFIAIAALAVLLLGGALREREVAHAALTETRDALEIRIRERTRALAAVNETLSLEVAARKEALERLEAETAERRHAEEILHQSQKMEAIGQLTGGIAHDFNNLLTVILGSLSLADRMAAGNERLKRLLNSARTAADRGAGLTRDLLAFSRRQRLHTEIVNPSERLIGTCNLLRRSLRGDIKLEVHLPRDLRPISVDAGQLELALLNIGLNARDAMPNGGVLRVGARNVALEQPLDGLRGDFVALSIADTGTGIPDAVKERVFEPFFTTKDVGKGSGLGLSQAYGFAKQSGGTIQIDSTVDQGTTVTLYLPAAPADALPRPGSPAAADAATGRAGDSVLIVEDDPDVAAVAAQMIEELGYTVRVAASARVALDLLRQGPPADLVFTDIMMPDGMNGVDLGRVLRAHFPDTAVLLATGFSEAAMTAEAKGFALITKPYHSDELAAAITRLLKSRRARLAAASGT